MYMRSVVTAVFLWVHVKNHAQERRHSSHCKFLSLETILNAGIGGRVGYTLLPFGAAIPFAGCKYYSENAASKSSTHWLASRQIRRRQG